jgi:prepilin-type processing-associated H-X9-DG protein
MPTTMTAASPPQSAQLLGLAVASLVLGILSITCFSILAGIPAVVCGIVALVRIGGAKASLRGQGQAIAGIVTGGMSLLLFPVLAALLLPALASARGKAVEVKCMDNVKQCAQACLMYASDHGDTLPSKWEDLAESLGSANALSAMSTCPSHRGAAEPSYELLEGGRRLSEIEKPGETIIVRETSANHRNRRAVAYADGHIEMTGQ